MTNPQWSGGDCINPAQAYTHNLVNPLLFSVVKTVKEASAVCRSFLDGVVIFEFQINRSPGQAKAHFYFVVDIIHNPWLGAIFSKVKGFLGAKRGL